MKVVVTEFDMLTPYGHGIDACWRGLLAKESRIGIVDRFDVSGFNGQQGGMVIGIDVGRNESIVYQMLEQIFTGKDALVASDTPLLLATTTGEVDLIERAVLAGKDDFTQGALGHLLEKVCRRLNTKAEGYVISSACASSTIALAQGASMICAGEVDSVFVVGCDALTEFVFSGFSSLMALDATGAHPFDRDRAGLSVGEGAAYMLLMSEDSAQKENRRIFGEIAGWGLSNDANHMTGPSRDGSGLRRAINSAFNIAAIDQSQIGFVSAHGTGTLYNDNMEMLAFDSVFNSPRPVWSVKGGMGHSMGATGMIEVLLALKSFEDRVVPPTVGLRNVDPVAAGWVSSDAVPVDAEYALSTNSGFGGVNAALILHNPEVKS